MIYVYIILTIVFILLALFFLIVRQRMSQELIVRKKEGHDNLEKINQQLDFFQDQLDQSSHIISMFHKFSIRILGIFKK